MGAPFAGLGRPCTAVDTLKEERHRSNLGQPSEAKLVMHCPNHTSLGSQENTEVAHL